jgi:trimethylamine---corrinoid protein Co-methyltransferase
VITAGRHTVWDEEACSRGHAAALEVLERVGVEVRHESGLALFRKAGARIEHTRVRLPAQLVDQALATAPRAFPLRGRDGDGAFDLDVRDGPVYFGSGSDCLYVLDPHTGERRRAVNADVEAGAALAERLPNIDFVMSMWLPEDAPQEVVELVQLAAMLTYTRKPIVVSSPRGGDAMREQVEMAAVCGGADSLACLTMSSPSLILDDVCVEKTLSCAELGVPMVLETGISLGTTGPVSLQTSAAVGHAEVMATLVLHQLVNPGAPFIYAAGISQLDMGTFVDLYGGPESGLASHLQLNLAQYLSLPTFDYAGYSDAKCHDEQCVAEILASTLGGALCGGTLLHDVGYLESGMLSSYEALVMGDEFAGYTRASMQEVPADDAAFLIAEVAEVGPGGSYLGRSSTRKVTRGWWRSELFDGSNFSQWQASGAHTFGDRLRARTTELLAAIPEPVVDPQAISDLAALVEQARERVAAGA